MYAVLKFKLPEEKEEFTTAFNALNYYCALVDIASFLRQDRKHGEGKFTEVESKFFEILNNHGVDLG